MRQQDFLCDALKSLDFFATCVSQPLDVLRGIRGDEAGGLDEGLRGRPRGHLHHGLHHVDEAVVGGDVHV